MHYERRVFDAPLIESSLCCSEFCSGRAGAVLNFFLMAQTVSHSVTLQQDEVKRKVRFSHSLRTLMLLVLMILGVALSCFNTIAALVPYLFPAAHHRRIQTDSP